MEISVSEAVDLDAQEVTRIDVSRMPRTNGLTFLEALAGKKLLPEEPRYQARIFDRSDEEPFYVPNLKADTFKGLKDHFNLNAPEKWVSFKGSYADHHLNTGHTYAAHIQTPITPRNGFNDTYGTVTLNNGEQPWEKIIVPVIKYHDTIIAAFTKSGFPPLYTGEIMGNEFQESSFPNQEILARPESLTSVFRRGWDILNLERPKVGLRIEGLEHPIFLSPPRPQTLEEMADEILRQAQEIGSRPSFSL